MTETYYLNKGQLPIIPTPHDCVVKTISLEDRCIVFEFEEDISDHDSIMAIKPGARSLIIRYHLTEYGEYSIYKWLKPHKLFLKNGGYKCLPCSALSSLTNGKPEYLYHNVGYCSIIIKLCSDGFIILDVDADRIEYEWLF